MAQLKKIRNELFVSDRIVTYKTAAAILQINVNESKRLLDQFLADMKSKNESLCVTYVVGGVTSDKRHKIVLVAGSKYEKVKSNFSSVTIDHIYSLQKSPHVEWIAIANVDDLMQNKKTESPVDDVKIKVEKDLPMPQTNEVTNKNTSKPAAKKGSISNFFSQSTGANEQQNKLPTKESTAKKTQNSKHAKPNALASFITKNSNKENNSKVSNTTAAIVKTVETTAADVQSDHEDEEFVVRNHKKRSRVLNDDDDDDNDSTPTNKCAKVDILDDKDDNNEEEMQFDDTSEDIFGSPERDDELGGTEETLPSDVAEKGSQNSTETAMKDHMYEDSDGYFVTERAPRLKKNTIEVPKQSQEKQKEVEKKEKVEKTITKQKIKTNTNQKTLFNFFTKK